MKLQAASGRSRLPGGGAWWWAIVAVCAFSSQAAELSYGLEYAAERSSNIRLAPVLEEEETISSVRLHATYREQVPTFRAEIATSSEYRDYRRDLFRDETLFLFDGTAVWTPIPFFSWMVADSYRNVPVSQALPDIPTNREDANTFVTGPNLEWRITPADYLITEARYGRFDAEEVDIDNDRYSGALRWRRRHSSLAENSINYEHLRVQFDNDVANVNYTRQDLFYRGQFRRSRNELIADLGYTDISRERLPDIDGSLFRLTAARDVTASRRIGVAVSSQYSDTALDLAPSGIGAAAPPLATAEAAIDVLTGDVFYTKRAEAFFTSVASPLSWSFQVFTADTDYEESPSDVEEVGGQLSATYYRTSNLSFTAYSRHQKSEYGFLTRTDRDSVNGVGVSLRLRRNLLLSAEAVRAERRSTDSLMSYTNDQLFVRLAYGVTRVWN